MDKISTNTNNAKWHTLWKKRMAENKPREGDYNFVVWKKGSEIIIEPWSKSEPPSIYQNGQWVALSDNYMKENDGSEES